MARRSPLAESKKTGEPGWSWRKAAIFPVVAFCLWRLSVMESGGDSEVNEAIVFWYGSLVAVLLLGYTGFASAQDVAAILATKSGLPYNPESSPAEPPPSTDVTVESGASVEVKAG